MDRKRVYEIVDGERDWQDRKWGTITEHPHEVGAWILLMQCHLREAAEKWAGSNGDQAALTELRKVIGLGVSCAEQHGLPVRWKHGEMEQMREPSP